MTTQELKPSQELLDTILEVNRKYGESKDLILKAYNLAIRDKFTPKQAREFLMAQITFLSESTIRKALPEEAKDQSKVRNSFAVNKSQNPSLGSTDTVNITTKHKLIDTNQEPKDETPTADELAEINQSLEIPQTQTIQNKTSDVQSLIENAILNEENIFEWLNKREDKIKCFYFGSCGTGFIKANILKNLENSGVKTFKRLYFEV